MKSVIEQLNLTQDERIKLDKVVRILLEGAPGIVSLLNDLEEKLGMSKEDVMFVVEQRISDLTAKIEKLKLEKGDKGDDGEDYVLTEEDKKEIASQITVPVVEKVVEKIIEKTEVIKEQPIITNEIVKEIKEVAMYESAEALMEKIALNDLLAELEKRLTTRIDGIKNGATGVRGFQLYDTGTKRGMINAINFVGATYSKVNGLDTLTFSASTGYQAPLSGDVDGSNTTFTWSTAPNVIVVDGGRAMRATSSDGTVNWTGTTTTVLTISPTFDIYAVA